MTKLLPGVERGLSLARASERWLRGRSAVPVPTLEVSPPQVGLALWGEPQRGTQRPWTEGLQAHIFRHVCEEVICPTQPCPLLRERGQGPGKGRLTPSGIPAWHEGAASTVLVSLWINSAPPPLWNAVPQSLSTFKKSLSLTTMTFQPNLQSSCSLPAGNLVSGQLSSSQQCLSSFIRDWSSHVVIHS